MDGGGHDERDQRSSTQDDPHAKSDAVRAAHEPPAGPPDERATDRGRVPLDGRRSGTDVGRRPGATRQSLDGPHEEGADDDGAGLVSLVGSGPGHPDLLTRRAWKRIARADVILYDSLTGDAVVDELPDSAALVDVGKRPPDRTSQGEIHALLRRHASRGERVVRLKGGDPTVFGRGGEEAEFLAGEGISFEVVSGVSSVLAAASASAIPLTHRDCASSFTVVTGHETPEKEASSVDWSALADTVTAGGTLFVLMGVERLPENVRALRDHGVPADVPVALVQKATWAEEQTVVGSLETIVERSREAAVEPPAVTVVGDVVDVRDRVEESFVDS